MKPKTFWREKSAFSAYNKSKHLAPKTIESYDSLLRCFHEWFICEYGEEAEITARRIREYIASRLAKGNAPSTVRFYADIMRAFYSFLVLDEVIDEDHNPMRRVKSPKVPAPGIKPLTTQETQRFLAAFDKRNLSQYRNYVICLLILDTGLRAGEALGLRLDDIDFDNSSIEVRGKGGSIRIVYIGRTLHRLLQDYLDHCWPWLGPCDSVLFPASRSKSRGERIQPSHLSTVVRDKFDQVGISRASSSTHRLRHTFATNYLRNGGNVLSLQNLLGHKSLQMTRRYVMFAQEDLRLMHQKASPVDRMRDGLDN